MREALKGRVNNMCTIGEAMALQAIRQGLQQGRCEGRREGRQEGRREGRQEGRRDTMREMVVNMRKNGLSIENIVLYTGIPLSDVSGYISDENTDNYSQNGETEICNH